MSHFSDHFEKLGLPMEFAVELYGRVSAHLADLVPEFILNDEELTKAHLKCVRSSRLEETWEFDGNPILRIEFNQTAARITRLI